MTYRSGSTQKTNSELGRGDKNPESQFPSHMMGVPDCAFRSHSDHVNASVNGCLSMCPVIGWRPIHGEVCLLAPARHNPEHDKPIDCMLAWIKGVQLLNSKHLKVQKIWVYSTILHLLSILWKKWASGTTLGLFANQTQSTCRQTGIHIFTYGQFCERTSKLHTSVPTDIFKHQSSWAPW